MFIKISKHNIFLTISLFLLNILIIHTATTENEMERVCSSGGFDNEDHKNGYRTIQHYADDDNIEITEAHPFYRSLFMKGEKSNVNLFINSIG